MKAWSAHSLALLFVMFSLAACSPPAPPADGGVDVQVPADTMVGPDNGPTDAPRDAPRDVVVLPDLYIPCTTNAQCGTGRTCILEYAGGMCSRACTLDSQCGTGLCDGRNCRPTCTLGGGECSTTQACEVISSADPDRRVCFPSCWVTPPTGATPCSDGFMCDNFTFLGNCTRSPLPTGAPNGDPCMTSDDCMGTCQTEISSAGNPSGNADGYCVSYGRTPDITLYGPDLPMPQSNCPTGTVLVPFNATTAAEGDSGRCMKSCTQHSDCRLGYGCIRNRYTGSRMSSNGYCAAINCLFADFAMMPNNRCPAGFFCAPSMTGTGGVCTRGTAPTDGGMGTDAATDVVAPTDSGTDTGAPVDVSTDSATDVGGG